MLFRNYEIIVYDTQYQRNLAQSQVDKMTWGELNEERYILTIKEREF